MHKADIKFNTISVKPSKYWLSLLVLLAIGIGYASTSEAAKPETEQVNTTAYVDSVHKWGAWELDIEPAAGGIQAPKTQPVQARETRLTLRTNSFSAIAPVAPPAPVVVATDSPLPAPIPATPPAPPAPPVTPPIGGPADGLF